MTILDQMRGKVEVAREKIATMQRGEKLELKLPIINAMRANMEKRVKERKIFLRRGETSIPPPPPPPPIVMEKTQPPPTTPETKSITEKLKSEKIYV